MHDLSPLVRREQREAADMWAEVEDESHIHLLADLKLPRVVGIKGGKAPPTTTYTHARAHTQRLTPHCTRLDLDLKRFNSLKWEREHFWAGFRSGSKQIRKPRHPPRSSSVPGSTFSWCGDDTGTRRWKSIKMARARSNGESVSHDQDPG